MKTVEAIKGNESRVLESFGLSLTGNRHIDCGICGGKKKLRICMYNDTLSYICSCGNGDIIGYIVESTGREFRNVAKDIDTLLGNVQETKSIDPVESLKDKCLRKFKRLPHLKDTGGQIYLNSRGIFNLPKNGIRFNSVEGKFQSLYAIATNDNYDPIYLHRTLLDEGKKADVEVNKKMLTLMDYIGSVSIKFTGIRSTLGVAEGIETALSCNEIYKCPAWSTLNSSILKRFKAPMGVEHLIVFADNDRKGAGHAAAFECAHRNMVANNNVKRVSVRWPESVCDFNDMLLNGSEVLEWRFDS